MTGTRVEAMRTAWQLVEIFHADGTDRWDVKHGRTIHRAKSLQEARAIGERLLAE